MSQIDKEMNILSWNSNKKSKNIRMITEFLEMGHEVLQVSEINF